MSIAIEPGSTLAHYRVIAPLGAGGMGEVYKAQDLTLDRTLALKILPPELVRNDERVRRFMQEARSASSLNHPNIITIYEIGQADSIHYIAMELIDGATLSRKIHASDADLRTLLEYLAQAAEGLAKAHAAGIVHRDLKPENIMVTRDGYAKVLDFGLAKLSTKRSPDPTNESTIARDNTREGTLLGTVAYMSPEQAQGKPLDHRSDIFSFGAILYEAATKRRPFEADSDIDILHKIVHDKPPAIDEIDPSVPAELRRLIRRCLAKDPEKRHQSMKNLSLELMEIVEEFEELSASATSASRSHSGPIAAPKRNRWIAPAAIVAALAIAGVAAWQWPRGAVATATAPPAFARMQITPLTTSGNVTDAAISPDGRYVAHIVLDGSRFSLRVRQVATGSDVEIIPQGELPLYYVSFSRDGDYIYYVQYDNPAGSGYGTLFRIPALGGPARKIIFDVDTKVSESPDMKQITFVRGAPVTSKNHLFVANADGTGAKIIETSVRVGPPLNPAWSPDGKTIILPRMTVAGDSRAEIAAIDPTSGSKRILRQRWEQPGSVAWLSDGSAFVTTPAATNSDFQQVWLQPFPDGEPVRITNDLNRYFDVSVTADGKTLAAVQAEQDVELSIVDGATKRPFTDRMGNTRRPLHFGVARSGAVVTDLDTSEGANIAIIDAPGAAPRLLTNNGFSGQPSVSADGQLIAFRSRGANGELAIFVMDSDGGNVRRIGDGVWPVIAPDGSFLIYMNRSDTSLWQVPISGGTPVRIAERTNISHAISPDSKRIAYTYRKPVGERNVVHLAVVPAGGGPLEVDIPLTTWGLIRFSPSGESIVYRRFSAGAVNLFEQPLSGGSPRQLTDFKRGVIEGFDYGPGGKTIITGGETRSDVVLIRNFR